MNPRTDALINGGLIALGTAGILDNVIAHWLLGLHRVVAGESALAVEVGLLVASAAMLAVGLGREVRSRRSYVDRGLDRPRRR